MTAKKKVDSVLQSDNSEMFCGVPLYTPVCVFSKVGLWKFSADFGRVFNSIDKQVACSESYGLKQTLEVVGWCMPL